jgi:acetolactate synthase-1/2/3 large subunit
MRCWNVKLKDSVSFPDPARIMAAYGIPYTRIASTADFDRIDETLTGPGPMFCEVVMDPEQGYEPRVKSRALRDGTIVSPSLEHMFPYPPESEVAENMEPSLAKVSPHTPPHST